MEMETRYNKGILVIIGFISVCHVWNCVMMQETMELWGKNRVKKEDIDWNMRDKGKYKWAKRGF